MQPPTSFRTLLAISAGRRLKLMQLDVSNAFTQADMDDVDLFVEPPRGHETWEVFNGRRVSKLLLLKRALYDELGESVDNLRHPMTKLESGSNCCTYGRWGQFDNSVCN